MLKVKKQLLAALGEVLDQMAPGTGAKAQFESPKVAAHGDLATTVAMQLARTLKANPRQFAESLRAHALETAAFSQWVDAVDVAGPGFLNIRLKAAAKQQVVREVLLDGSRFGCQPANGRRLGE